MINTRIENASTEEPPYEINGSGMPITGIKPMVIPTLIIICKKKKLATQYAYTLENGER